jgi:glycosyltransferase involved in cell wall biosynthesis
MTIGIVIPTYRKPDGSTKIHLERALRSIKNQVYQDYKVILVGDQYEDQNELIHMSKIIDEEKITVINLPRAIEREKYR